jgi:putative spermidine/putrescine transport system permease protein/mannopine transport system permease protein
MTASSAASAEGGILGRRRPGALNHRNWFAAPAVALITAVFAMPLLVIVVQSFYHEGFTFRGYEFAISQPLFWRILTNTVEISVQATLVSLLVGYPIAYYLSQLGPRGRAFGMTLVLIPFWTSILVKSFAFVVILGQSGIVKTFFLSQLGIRIEASLLFNRFGVVIGMTHYLVPFVVFPVLTNLLSQPPALRQAAALLGASPMQVFWKVTFPLSIPALIAAASLVTVLALGAFAVPALLGGRRDMMISGLVDYYTREVLDWNYAAALSVILLLMTGAIVWILSRFDKSTHA